MNNVKTWQQGKPLKTGEKFDSWHDQKVFSPLTNDCICMAFSVEDAKWIASRLNLASELEQLTYDFATGKTDGEEITEFVHSKI